MSSLRLLFLPLILITLWTYGLVHFFYYTTSLRPEYKNSSVGAQGIVVFTGGDKRIKTAAILSQQEPHLPLLISGVSAPKKYVLPNLVGATQKITLGYEAKDTLGNAQEAAAWVQKQGIQSLRVITSDYHMARSIFELSNLLPCVTLIPHPIKTQCALLNPVVVTEYHKFIYALLRALNNKAKGIFG